MLPLGIKKFLHSCIVYDFCLIGEEAKTRNEPSIWLPLFQIRQRLRVAVGHLIKVSLVYLASLV